MLCAWCQDIVSKDDVAMDVAKRSGAAGRRGNTIRTAICADFGARSTCDARPRSWR
jgi:hypothetical protein